MVKRHNTKMRKIKGLLRLVRKRDPFLHENPFLKNFSDFGDTLLVGTSVVGWFSTLMKKLWFLGLFFLFQKIRMVPVLVLRPEKMAALSSVLIQFLKKINIKNQLQLWTWVLLRSFNIDLHQKEKVYLTSMFSTSCFTLTYCHSPSMEEYFKKKPFIPGPVIIGFQTV